MRKIEARIIGYGAVGKGIVDHFLQSKNQRLNEFSLNAIGIQKESKERFYCVSPCRHEVRLPPFTTCPLDDIIALIIL